MIGLPLSGLLKTLVVWGGEASRASQANQQPCRVKGKPPTSRPGLRHSLCYDMPHIFFFPGFSLSYSARVTLLRLTHNNIGSGDLFSGKRKLSDPLRIHAARLRKSARKAEHRTTKTGGPLALANGCGPLTKKGSKG